MSPASEAQRLQHIGLKALSADEQRNRRLKLRVGPIHADLSRQFVDAQSLDRLFSLAHEVDLDAARQALAVGADVNVTEQRPALHHALRAEAGQTDGSIVGAAQSAAAQVLEQMRSWIERLRTHGFGPSEPLRDVINVGIGGSDLGPRLLCEAIGGESPVNLHFVSSVDAHRAASLIGRLDPRTTAVVLVSKSFGTEETLLNGQLFITWLNSALGEQGARLRLFAVTAKVDAARAFGVAPSQCLSIWDWVGGRYSLWSAVGFSFALAHGFDAFRRLLAGAREMDRHFFDTPFEQNLPVLRGVIEHWNRSALDFRSRCVVPYDVRVAQLPAYLQQLEMESNGKSVQKNGQPVATPTAPVVWGGVGTDAQHAFFQALHQGTQIVPVEFIGVIRPAHAHAELHRVLLANLLAQSAALAYGNDTTRSADPLASHKHHQGGRPSTVLLLDALTPESLGALLAMYEHSVFVEACLAGINPFDQWGVELGKRIAREFLPALTSDAAAASLDPVTQSLLREIRSR